MCIQKGMGIKVEKKEITKRVTEIVLFLCITIILVTVYYKALPILNVYGFEVFKTKEYEETENFKSSYISSIGHLESTVNWGIDLNSTDEQEFSYWNQANRNLEYILDIELTNGKQMILSNLQEDEQMLRETMQDFRNSERYYICKLNTNPETSEDYLKYILFHADQSKFKKLDVYMRIENLEKPDSLQTNKNNYEDFVEKLPMYLLAGSILLVIIIFLVIYITKQVKDRKNFLDSLYFEEIMVLVCLIGMIGGFLISGETVSAQMLGNVYKYLIYFLSYLFLLEAYLLIVKRIKTKDFKNSLLFLKIGKNMEQLYPSIAISIIVMVLILFFLSMKDYESFFIENIVGLIVLEILLYYLGIDVELVEIAQKIEKIANGNFDIKLKYRNRRYQKLIDNINRIQIGMKEVVDEKVKTEKLKTDLITNVSHDLKTPLTSIINYTKLLKKEKIQNEKIKKYIQILENKSNQLKNLTEDLIDISKLSSGNEKVNWERLNFAEMVLQANGEFAEKFEEKNLILVSNLASEEIYLDLDSKKMWRVLENIYSNIYKYALENTRVYIDVKPIEGNAIEFVAKNISKEELNINPNELMERFVRGDKTRTREGSGLGLSIAKELIKLQKGDFNIDIEGDLFKVRIVLSLSPVVPGLNGGY